MYSVMIISQSALVTKILIDNLFSFYMLVNSHLAYGSIYGNLTCNVLVSYQWFCGS